MVGRRFVVHTAHRLLHDARDLLFPIACVGCERYGNADGWLCAACCERIRPAWPTCCVCGAHAPTGRTCYGCLTETPLQGVIAVGRYADHVLRAAITQFKFRGVRALAQPLGELLARRVSAAGFSPQTVLVPMPLHPRRERERGFNQARLLAEVIGAALKLQVENLLVRTRATSPQTSIIESPRARRANIQGAFQIRSPLPDLSREARPVPRSTGEVGRAEWDTRWPVPNVILIDDVLTTGATMREAASVLSSAGAPEIWAAVVARGNIRKKTPALERR